MPTCIARGQPYGNEKWQANSESSCYGNQGLAGESKGRRQQMPRLLSLFGRDQNCLYWCCKSLKRFIGFNVLDAFNK